MGKARADAILSISLLFQTCVIGPHFLTVEMVMREKLYTRLHVHTPHICSQPGFMQTSVHPFGWVKHVVDD